METHTFIFFTAAALELFRTTQDLYDNVIVGALKKEERRPVPKHTFWPILCTKGFRFCRCQGPTRKLTTFQHI
jgi:hypothetical protein